MKIEPRFLAPYLRDAAVEQMRSELVGAGYSLEQPATDDAVFWPDIVARRGSELIAFGVKVFGFRSSSKLADASRWAREHGAELRLLLVRPQREMSISIAGVEDLLMEALRAAGNDLPVPLAGAYVGGVTNVLLGEVEIGLGASDMETSGSALALFDLPGRDSEREAGGRAVPFTFTLWFDPAERRLTRPARITWDLSELDEDA